MRITRIDIEGREGRYATITRKKDSPWIEVTIITAYQPDGKVHRIAADADGNEVWIQAKSLHRTLNGFLGTNGDIQGYFDELQRFAD